MLCCPSCGSEEIYVETGGVTGNIYRCKRCGYRGPLVLEVDEEIPGPEGKKRKDG
ncbi:MAG: hypothetical protein LUO86_05830 [Methanomicrobiales archaeon]|jgi:uncharacterized Zn finger protein|nr:hypothetical protein [Methanomicrobiales archaeon]MDD1655405.1 hypothetical protein [Methanomicrobiales archaeon]